MVSKHLIYENPWLALCAHCGISFPLLPACWPDFTCQFCRQFLWEEKLGRSIAVHGGICQFQISEKAEVINSWDNTN